MERENHHETTRGRNANAERPPPTKTKHRW